MAKDMASLVESREIRANVLRKYGFIPTSVLEPDYAFGKHIIEFDERKQQAVAKKKHEKMDYGDKTSFGEKKVGLSKEALDKTFGMSSQNVRGKTGGLSTFPPALARFIVEFYSEKGDSVLDSMAGHNSRLQITVELGRHYTGYDICHEFQEFNREIAKQIQGKGKQTAMFTPQVSITLREQTSEKMVEDDETFDMAYTSPPYSVEFYDNHPLQIGTNETYEQMLQRLETVLSETYRVLKTGGYCIWNVNDFRKGGVFYPFHADIMFAFKRCGFILHDFIIVRWQSCIGQAFASQIESRKIVAKAHEVLIVGKK